MVTQGPSMDKTDQIIGIVDALLAKSLHTAMGHEYILSGP